VDDPTTTPEVSQPRLVGPPTRRHLPVLKMAVVVFVLFVGASWWVTRARCDPRFVGTWVSTSSRDSRTATLHLDSSGHGRTDVPGQGPLEYQWKVSNDRLIFRLTDAKGLGAIHERFLEAYDAVTGKRSGMDVAYEASVIDADTIILRGPVGAGPGYHGVSTMRRSSQ
jgi:hypothetical protein